MVGGAPGRSGAAAGSGTRADCKEVTRAERGEPQAALQALLRDWVDLRVRDANSASGQRRRLDTVQIPALRAFGFSLLVLLCALAPQGVPRWIPCSIVVYVAASHLMVRAWY